MTRSGFLLLFCAACRTVDAPPPPPPAPVFYEVFVRSFRDSNGDGVGDLKGLTQSLAYLQDLGVGGIWLMPIHPSPSYHGYDVTDFHGVNPAYGTLDDFTLLLSQAHARGINVMMDLVVNHTSDQHPWFTQKPDWYLWRNNDPAWIQPWPGGGRTWWPSDGRFYFGLFSPGMPDLDYRNAAVRAEMNHIARTWLDLGVDGFRVDAARHLVEGADGTLADVEETHACFRSMRKELWKTHPGTPLVAEAWTSRTHVEPYRGNGDEFTHAFDFDLAQAMVASLLSGKAALLAQELRAIQHWDFEATFLGNHDQDRLLNRLYGDVDAVRAAHVMLLTLPGMPFLYYGDELLMPNGPQPGDPGKRTPMKWNPDGGFSTGTPWEELAPSTDVATASADAHSLLQLIRALTRLRASLGAFRLEASPHPSVVAYARGKVHVRINVSDEEVRLPMPPNVRVLLGAEPGVLGPRGFSIY